MAFHYPYAATSEGRVLIALRAGPVYSDAIIERVGDNKGRKALTEAVRKGLVNREKIESSWLYSLTEAGRAKVPERRSVIRWVPPECRAVASEEELSER